MLIRTEFQDTFIDQNLKHRILPIIGFRLFLNGVRMHSRMHFSNFARMCKEP